MPKLKSIVVPYTKNQINEILNLTGWIDSKIDAFNLYGVLTIGVTNNTRGPSDSWEITQRTYSENPLKITLADFEGCNTSEEVKQRFKIVLQKAVSAAMFPGDKVF